LTLSLDNSSSWKQSGALNDNNSVGNKTINVWVKDDAHNVSEEYTAISIFFDNASPAWDNDEFFMRASNSDNATYNLYYFDNASDITIVSDNVTHDNDSGGSGITGYFFTDNVSRLGSALADNSTKSDNNSVWETPIPNKIALDNTSDGVHTIYGFIKDAAGNISDNISGSITLDTNAPVIDNLTWDNSTGFQVSSTTDADNQTGNFTIYLYANDNESNGFSSGWKDYYLEFELYRTDNQTRASLESISTTDDNVADATFSPITDFVVSDNYSFDNASKVITFTAKNEYVTFDTSDMSAKVILWLRDNASNISDNKTWYFHANHGEAGASSL
jgi:hypothetical protein